MYLFFLFFFFLMIRRPPRSTLDRSSAASDVYKRQVQYAVRDLGTLGGTVTAAGDVNAMGQVVGFSMTGDGFLHAFVWDRGVMTDLGTLGGESSYATAIND